MNRTRELERVVKGFSNHRRIQILYLLDQNPDLSVIDVAEKLRINMKTASEHIRRLMIAGLVIKRNDLNYVRHTLSKLGKSILVFLRTLE